MEEVLGIILLVVTIIVSLPVVGLMLLIGDKRGNLRSFKMD